MDTHTHIRILPQKQINAHTQQANGELLTVYEAFYQLILIKCTLFIFAITYEFDVQFPIIYRDTHIFFLLQFFFISINFLRFVFRISFFPVWSSDEERKIERMSKGGLHSAPAAQAAVGRKIKTNKTKKEEKKN